MRSLAVRSLAPRLAPHITEASAAQRYRQAASLADDETGALIIGLLARLRSLVTPQQFNRIVTPLADPLRWWIEIVERRLKSEE